MNSMNKEPSKLHIAVKSFFLGPGWLSFLSTASFGFSGYTAAVGNKLLALGLGVLGTAVLAIQHRKQHESNYLRGVNQTIQKEQVRVYVTKSGARHR